VVAPRAPRPPSGTTEPRLHIPDTVSTSTTAPPRRGDSRNREQAVKQVSSVTNLPPLGPFGARFAALSVLFLPGRRPANLHPEPQGSTIMLLCN